METVELVIDEEVTEDAEKIIEEVTDTQESVKTPAKKRERKERKFEDLIEAPLKGMTPREKNSLIKGLKEQLQKEQFQATAFAKSATENQARINEIEEYLAKTVQQFNKKIQTILVFSEQIIKTIKGE